MSEILTLATSLSYSIDYVFFSYQLSSDVQYSFFIYIAYCIQTYHDYDNYHQGSQFSN